MFVWSCGRGRSAGRPAGRTSGRTSGRTVVGGARVVSGAEKKAFDRGGPVWPPRSNAADDRLGGASGGALPPQPKIGGSGGQRLPAKIRGEMDFFRKYLKKKLKMMPERGPQTVCSSEFIRTATTKVGRNPLGPVPTYAALCTQNRLRCPPAGAGQIIYQ